MRTCEISRFLVLFAQMLRFQKVLATEVPVHNLVMWLWRKLMYEVLTQLLAIPNYQVIATDIGEDTIALEI